MLQAAFFCSLFAGLRPSDLADLSRSIDQLVFAYLYEKKIFLTWCVFEPEDPTHEAGSSAGPYVRRGEGMPGLLTGHVGATEIKEPSELRRLFVSRINLALY